MESGTPRGFRAWAIANSFFGFAKEKSSEMAMDSGCLPCNAGSIAISNPRAKARSGFRRRWPCVRRSRSGDLSGLAVRRGRRKNRRALGRAWRPISMASSKPAVVTRAVRAPLRSSSVLVPTVVPCRRTNCALVVNFAEGFDDGLRGIGGSRENFQHAQAAVRICPDTVSEGAAGVDGDAKRLGRAGHVRVGTLD